MLPDIKVPEELIRLKKALIDAASDDACIKMQERVYGGNPEREVEWDINCELARMRITEAAAAYEVALKLHSKGNAGKLWREI